jgi:hypothetical protein
MCVGLLQLCGSRGSLEPIGLLFIDGSLASTGFLFS